MRIWVNTVSILTSLKAEIARSVRGPKLQGPRAEDPLAESYLVQKIFGDVITADHKVLSEGCESGNNHRYAIVVQDLATQWIQAYLHRKPREACKSSWSQIGSLKSFTLTIPWNLANPVKIFPGIIVPQQPHRSETNGVAVSRVKEGTSAVLLQSGLGNEWWADSMECYCHLRNIQDLLSDGKTPDERRFGEHF